MKYIPQRMLNRRKRVSLPASPDVTAWIHLSLFMLLLAFFMAFVSFSAPSRVKTQDLFVGLDRAFAPSVRSAAPILSAPPPVPEWLSAGRDGQTAPLESLRKIAPHILTQAGDQWGQIVLRFEGDEWQRLFLQHPALVRELLSGFGQRRAGDDGFLAVVTVGTDHTPNKAARRVVLKRLRDQLRSLGVHETRIMAGVAYGEDAIMLRYVPAAQLNGGGA